MDPPSVVGHAVVMTLLKDQLYLETVPIFCVDMDWIELLCSNLNIYLNHFTDSDVLDSFVYFSARLANKSEQFREKPQLSL